MSIPTLLRRRRFGGVLGGESLGFWNINGETHTGASIPEGATDSQIAPDGWTLDGASTPPAWIYYPTGLVEQQLTFDRQAGGSAQDLRITSTLGGQAFELTEGQKALLMLDVVADDGGNTYTFIKPTVYAGTESTDPDVGYMNRGDVVALAHMIPLSNETYELRWRPSSTPDQNITIAKARFYTGDDLMRAQGIADWRDDWASLSETFDAANVPTGWRITSSGEARKNPTSGMLEFRRGGSATAWIDFLLNVTPGNRHAISVKRGTINSSNTQIRVENGASGSLLASNTNYADTHMQVIATPTQDTMRVRLAPTNSTNPVTWTSVAVVDVDGGTFDFGSSITYGVQ